VRKNGETFVKTIINYLASLAVFCESGSLRDNCKWCLMFYGGTILRNVDRAMRRSRRERVYMVFNLSKLKEMRGRIAVFSDHSLSLDTKCVVFKLLRH
jgi:hypothetical protein